MTAVADLVPALKRELAVPGGYDDLFPDSDDDELAGYLADAFGEAQLYGFFATTTLDTDLATTPDLSTAGAALVSLFAAMRIIRAQLRNLNASERYKAGSTEYEITRAATVLKQELTFLQQRITDLITAAKRQALTATAYVSDNYFARGGATTYGGFFMYELVASVPLPCVDLWY
jgi:hypothetical protein